MCLKAFSNRDPQSWADLLSLIQEPTPQSQLPPQGSLQFIPYSLPTKTSQSLLPSLPTQLDPPSLPPPPPPSSLPSPPPSPPSPSPTPFSTTDSSLSSPPSAESIAKEYFSQSNQKYTGKKFDNVVKLISGLSSPAFLKAELCKDLWSPRSGVFESSDSEPRTVRLHKGVAKIKQDDQVNCCVKRITEVFFIHEVDIRATTISNKEATRLVDKVSTAVRDIAHELSIDPQAIINQRRRCNTYVYLLITGGPGALLDLDRGLDTM